ncbi:hypothetical protein ACVLD2_000398 [Paenibacillus sp. PvR052]
MVLLSHYKVQELRIDKIPEVGQNRKKVSEISLGSWMTYGGYVDHDKSVRSIERPMIWA